MRPTTPPRSSARSIRADVRIIAATHKDLPRLIADHAFREDLYYRLNVVPVRLPALRERTGDIGELARHFLDRAAADGLPRKLLDPAAVERAITAAADLVGTFDKTKFVTFHADLCAHSRSRITGCTRCLEVCPTGAIASAGDTVAIDPYICAGCGNCAPPRWR